MWKETKTPEGRIYWYNTSTRQSTWKKPEVLWTEQEKAINACPWKEYTTPEGKKYYSHKETKQTTWQIPQAYQGNKAWPLCISLLKDTHFYLFLFFCI